MSNLNADRLSPPTRPLAHSLVQARSRQAASELHKGSLNEGFLLASSMPQYTRTFIQGCACSTGIAGGGCCPGGAAGVAGQGAHAGHAGHALGLLGGAFAAAGIYSGVRVMRNAGGALTNLRAVNGALQQRRGEMRRRLEHLQGIQSVVDGTESAAAAAARRRSDEASLFLSEVKVSIREQVFNWMVPGVLQLSAATATGLSSLHHLTGGALGAVAGQVLGCSASGLFAAYGASMAIKNAFDGWHDAHAKPLSACAPVDYKVAYKAHVRARCFTSAGSAVAWSVVAAAGTLGALIAGGAVALPGLGAVATGLALLGAAGAIWQNSRTRYVPHLPVSAHVDRHALATRGDRIAAWRQLSVQDGVIKGAVAQMLAQQTRATKTHHEAERLFRPQCGASAFQVLADAVQKGLGHGEREERQKVVEAAQVSALAAYAEAEIALLSCRTKSDLESAQRREVQLNKVAAASSGSLARAAQEQEAAALATEVADIEAVQVRLAVWRQIKSTTEGLLEVAGSLSTFASQPTSMSADQKLWLGARLAALQLSGTLADAVSADFFSDHKTYFGSSSEPGSLPLGNLFVIPNQQEAFGYKIAPQLDGAFVHAFFNPRRIEAEMDFLLDSELRAGLPRGGIVGAEPHKKSCCG